MGLGRSPRETWRDGMSDTVRVERRDDGVTVLTLARPDREKLFLQANRQIQQDAPWIFLYAQQDIYGLRNRLAGFEARPDPYIIVRDWSLTS